MSRADHSDPVSLLAQCERDVQQPGVLGLPQRMKSWFLPLWRSSDRTSRGSLKKHLLCLPLADPGPVHVLAVVARIPLEGFNPGKIDHCLYMAEIYRPRQFLFPNSAEPPGNMALVEPEDRHRFRNFAVYYVNFH